MINPPRSSETSTDQRVNSVYEKLLAGWSRKDICQYASDLPAGESWGVGERQIDRYIEKARALIQEQAAEHRGYEMGLAKARREALYKQALEYSDIKTALAVDQDRAKLADLYPTQRNTITIEQENPYSALSVAELTSILATLNTQLLAVQSSPRLPSGPECLESNTAEPIDE